MLARGLRDAASALSVLGPVRLDLPEIARPGLSAIVRPVCAPEEMIGRDRVVADARDERLIARAVPLHHEPVAAIAPRCARRPRRSLLHVRAGDLLLIDRELVPRTGDLIAHGAIETGVTVEYCPSAKANKPFFGTACALIRIMC